MVYGGGRERFYLLSELPPDQCAWGDDDRSWRFGDSTFTWTDSPGPEGGAPIRVVEADLNLALPTGGRITGRLRVSGSLRRDPAGPRDGFAGDAACTHLWSPLVAAGHGTLELQTPSGDLRVEGRAYHDRNSAAQPLDRLGIDRWWWGRLALPGRDLIFYRLVPSSPGAATRDLVVEVSANGSCRLREDAGLKFSRPRLNAWGLRWPSRVTFSDPDGRPAEVEVSAVLDNGPFYQRYLLRGEVGMDEVGGETGYGIGENLVPDRVDTDLLRPLVRMRVHRAEGPNSMWLPLFSGDSGGRVRRLLGLPGEVRA